MRDHKVIRHDDKAASRLAPKGRNGRFESAREGMQNVIDMYDPARDGPHSGMSTRDAKVSMCTLLGICLTILGRVDSGAAMSLAGVECPFRNFLNRVSRLDSKEEA